MKKVPLVSVIIPNYCHSKYLDQRIQSVLNQSYSNFEVFILDDCSPDEGASRAVIEKYRSNTHISSIFYNEKNSGSPFVQWKRGIDISKGDLIWIAESDDYCEKDFLAKMVDAYQKYPDVAYVFSTSILVDGDGCLCDTVDVAEEIPSGLIAGDFFIKKYMTHRNSVWNASAVCFSKDIALNIDDYYLEYKAAGDHLFWILLAAHGNVVHLSEHLNFFRQHNNKVTPKNFRNGVTWIEENRTIRYLKDKGLLNGYQFLDSVICYYRAAKHSEYDSEDIRSGVLREWKSTLDWPFFLCYLYYRIVLFLYKRISYFRGIIDK